MFNAIPAIDTFTTQSDSDSTRDADPGFAAPLPDAGALLAAVGLPAHAIQRGSRFPDLHRRGRLNREREGHFREDERRRDRERPVPVR